MSMTIVAGLGAIVVGALMALFPVYTAISDHNLQTNGRQTTGRVVDLQAWSHGIQDAEYQVYYTYPEMLSKKRYVQDNTDKNTWSALKLQQTIPVTYLPSNPDKSKFGRPQDMTFARHFSYEPRFMTLAIFMSALMIIGGIVCLLQARRHLYLVRCGTAVKGRITKLEATQNGYVTTYTARYEFTGPDGVERKGKGETNQQGFAGLREGQEVIVLVDTAKPNRYAAYPLMSAELAPSPYQAAVPDPSPAVEALPAEQGDSGEPQTFEEWREAVLAEYGAQLNMSREQTWEYLANRPYPPKIKLAAVVVGLMVLFALAQTPKYFDAAVHYQKAQSYSKAQRYGEALDELETIRSAGVTSPKEEYLYGFTLLTIGEIDEAKKILSPMTASEKHEAEIGALADQIKAAMPHWEAARKSMDAGGSEVEIRAHLEKAIEAWPTFMNARLLLASTYALQLTRTMDDRLVPKYSAELATIRRMDPKSAGLLDKTYGDVKNYKPAELLFRKAKELMRQKKYDEAMSAYREAIRIYPLHSRSHAYLAVACARKYETTGDKQFKDECLKEYRTAVNMNPKRTSVKPELGALAKEVE